MEDVITVTSNVVLPAIDAAPYNRQEEKNLEESLKSEKSQINVTKMNIKLNRKKRANPYEYEAAVNMTKYYSEHNFRRFYRHHAQFLFGPAL